MNMTFERWGLATALGCAVLWTALLPTTERSLDDWREMTGGARNGGHAHFLNWIAFRAVFRSSPKTSNARRRARSTQRRPAPIRKITSPWRRTPRGG